MKSIILLLIATVLLAGCDKDKDIEGHKILNINFSNAKTGAPVDSIDCFIGKTDWVSFRVVSDTYSDSNGNCELEVDYKSDDGYYFSIYNDNSFNSNKVFTNRINHPIDKYRVKNTRPFVDLGDKNEFDVKIQLIPLIKLKIFYSFSRDFNGYPVFEIFENKENIYSIYFGTWLRLANENDSTDCYVSSIEKTTLVYTFSTNDGKTIFSKSLLIDPDKITDTRINLLFE
jgi:hypothetical protein